MNPFGPIVVAILIASHNRRDQTIACLKSILKQETPENVNLKFYIIDDGSVDGTSEAVKKLIPSCILLHGDGSLFWNRAMRKIMRRSYYDGCDYFWCVNDDVIFHPFALKHQLETQEAITQYPPSVSRSNAVIVTGATVDPSDNTVTYGGLQRRNRFIPTEFQKIVPNGRIQDCEVVNMNSALISREVINRIGVLSHAYRHARGDFDFALRARYAGARVVLAPYSVGTCSLNPIKRKDSVLRSTFADRWKTLLSIKHKPLWESSVFLRRHGGAIWPVLWIAPYVLFLVRELFSAIKMVGRTDWIHH